jgi:hypothetical protein
MGSDHASVHIELHIGNREGKKAVFKSNISYLQEEIIKKIEKNENVC